MNPMWFVNKFWGCYSKELCINLNYQKFEIISKCFLVTIRENHLGLRNHPRIKTLTSELLLTRGRSRMLLSSMKFL